MLLEYQHRAGHCADLVVPLGARYGCGCLALRQPGHRSLQATERDTDVALDPPGGEQCHQQQPAADLHEPPQHGVERRVDVIDVDA